MLILLIFLILLIAFFSLSETGMMAVNKYRLRHLSAKSNRRATTVLKLLERPDRLLGVILIGNTFSTILASSVTTILAVDFFGNIGALIGTVVLTFVILIFAEIAPKTVAALYSQRIALFVAMPLKWLLKICYPVVWLVNLLANGILRIFGIHVHQNETDILSMEELRSVVHEATGKTSLHYQEMLLRVLDLQQVAVEEIMVPKNEIVGIDLENDWDGIVSELLHCTHAYLPVYSEHIDKVKGMLNLRHALVMIHKDTFDKKALLSLLQEPYFIPEGVLLHNQVLNFQQKRQHVGLIVDEYGDIQGLLTLRDLLEEIAGDFAMSAIETERFIVPQEDGRFLIDGSMSIRILNRLLGWHFPVNEARTLSGLIIAYLESIPKTPVCVLIGGYRIEVLSVSHNRVQQVLVRVGV